jgi:hypothetical protein
MISRKDFMKSPMVERRAILKQQAEEAMKQGMYQETSLGRICDLCGKPVGEGALNPHQECVDRESFLADRE